MDNEINPRRNALVEGEAPAEPARAVGRQPHSRFIPRLTLANHWGHARNRALVEGEAPAEPARAAGQQPHSRFIPQLTLANNQDHARKRALVEGEAPAEPARAAGRQPHSRFIPRLTLANHWDRARNRALVEGEVPAEPARAAKQASGSLPEGWHAPRKRPVYQIEPLKHHATIVFVTVCTKDRSPWLTTPTVQRLLREVWTDASEWMVGRYVIMPDHVHLFAGWVGDIPLKNWVQFWKSQFTKRHKVEGHVWQSGFWDTTMLSADQYAAKWEYVSENPVRHGFVKVAREWLYTGELNKLEWS